MHEASPDVDLMRMHEDEDQSALFVTSIDSVSRTASDPAMKPPFG
jgi:hypothetical protein